MRLAVQLPAVQPRGALCTADAVLLAIAHVEQHAQVTDDLLKVLVRQQYVPATLTFPHAAPAGPSPALGVEIPQPSLTLDLVRTESSHTARPRSNNSPGCAPLGLEPLAITQVAYTEAVAPAGDAPATAENKEGSLPSGVAGSLQQAQQLQLIPLLQRCGVLESLNPEHHKAAVHTLVRLMWTRLLAPASEFRDYFGDEVGFYLSYLNALTCWLAVPATLSSCLWWALRRSDADRAVLFSPWVPVSVLVQLVWSAAGIKLWRRYQASLRRRWAASSHTRVTSTSSTTHVTPGTSHTSVSAGTSISSSGISGASGAHASPLAANRLPQAEGASPVSGMIAPTPLLDAQPVPARVQKGEAEKDAEAMFAGNVAATIQHQHVTSSHLTGGVPAWAAAAPVSTGTRWQFSGGWCQDAAGRPELKAAVWLQVLRLTGSFAATTGLLGLAAATITACLNLQGLIDPRHHTLHMPWLTRLSLPGGLLSKGLLQQVPMAARVLAVSLFDTLVFGPAARWLTGLENRRTEEGYQASQVAKKAALQFLTTFLPVGYVGLAGAGAAAAANDAAGYFKYELVRRLSVEYLLPWTSLLLKTHRLARRHHPSHPTSHLSADTTADAMPLLRKPQASDPNSNPSQELNHSSNTAADAARTPFDTFTSTWDVTRDVGYVLLFASILPWAAPLTLIYTLGKIKQDCMALLLVHRRPLPTPLRSFGSWNAVLLVQVILAIITNVFLSGLSTSQLARLLPTNLVPPQLANFLTTAAATRPADSSAASKLSQGQSSGSFPLSPLAALYLPPSPGLQSNSRWHESGGSGGRVAAAGEALAAATGSTCPVPGLLTHLDTHHWQTAHEGVCGAGQYPSPPQLQTLKAGLAVLVAGGMGVSYLLLLFGIEHLLLLLVVLVMTCIPDDPGTDEEEEGCPQPLN